MVGVGNKTEPSFAPDPVYIELRGDFLFVLIGKDPCQVTGDEGFVDPEGEVMIVAGRHLDANEEEDPVVGSLVAVMLGLEPVMVGEHDEVDAVGPGRLDDFQD